MDLGLVLGFLVRKKVDLDEGVGEASGPVSWRQLTALDNLEEVRSREERNSSDNLL